MWLASNSTVMTSQQHRQDSQLTNVSTPAIPKAYLDVRLCVNQFSLCPLLVLRKDVDEAELSADDAKERRIMKLLLKVKNGTPPQRKAALRHLTDKARELGAKPLLDAILPLLMQPTLEDQERHLLVKVIDRWVGVECSVI